MKKMKDSGSQWIGCIPSYWDVGRIDNFYALRNTKVSDKDYPPLSVTMGGIVPQLDTAAKTNAHDDRKLVKRGDFAINSRSDRRGSCGISAYDGSVSLINTILAPKGEMDPEYYDWLFHTTQFADEFYKWGHGIVDDLWTTNYQDMKKINIPVPPVSEQHMIASYLNRQCVEIDALSADIQSEIDTLEAYKRSVITEAVTKGLDKNVPMKDSGIGFIGKIPFNWSVHKVKYLGSFRNGLTYSPLNMCDEEEGTLVLRSSNIQNGKLVLDNNVYVNCPIPKVLKVEKNDILICSRNGSKELIGKNVLLPDIDASFGAFMMIYRCKNPRYMFYVLNSSVFSYYLGTFFTSTINQLTGSNFGNMKVPYCPDIGEQEKIVTYLDSKCKDIDSIIAQKQAQLTVLADYKKSMIYEYVTGKKEVPVA